MTRTRKTLRRRFEDYLYEHHPKWSCIIYLASRGVPVRECLAMWKEAEEMPERDTFLGGEATTAQNFFYLNAEREERESEHYRCAYGCCLVIWHRGRNRGGMGPAGCPCDELDDPRGELTKEAGHEH